MDLEVKSGSIANWKGDGIVVPVFRDGEPDAQVSQIDQALGGALTGIIKESNFRGDLGTTRVIYTLGKLPAGRVCLVGLGKREDFTLDTIRRAWASAGKALRKDGAHSIAGEIFGVGLGGARIVDAAQAAAEGIVLGLWRFRKYMASSTVEGESEEDRYDLQSVVLLAPSESDVAAAKPAVERGRVIADGANLARELANEPGNKMTPTLLAKAAQEMADKNGLEFYKIDRDEAERKGMGAFLGVAQGSDQPPAMFVIRYWGAGKEREGGVGLIGKGITFDSGGISLKPGENMEHMKGDMSGGAAVIGALQAIAQLKPAVNVTGIVAAAENLPSGKAYKPGDILRASNGKTIEVVNTDAEGRLVLADAVAYATRELKLTPVLDAATLTGAIVIALGHHRTGVFSNDDELAGQIIAAGARTGERMWQLPMDKEYREQLRSDWADIKNTGGRAGGSITGAWFIRSFVENGAKWAHLDIAGTTQLGDGKERGYINKWGTGVPTRTFVEFVLDQAKKA